MAAITRLSVRAQFQKIGIILMTAKYVVPTRVKLIRKLLMSSSTRDGSD